MLSDRLIKKLEGIEKISKKKKDGKIQDLFKIMTNNPEIWLQAYANIYPNKGALTKGIDSSTLDGFSYERVANITEQLKEDRYRFTPSKRVYIPKSNRKLRPLGISSGNDKLVQEVTRMLLESCYEPVFNHRSHGFRANRSCHTALDEIQRIWTGTKWWVEIDIEKYFDTISHQKLLKLLETKIDDRKFIRIIKMMFKAGYMEDWKFHQTYSGVPQGSGASPILANIYLHELDQFMEKLKGEFDLGKQRRTNPEYRTISLRIHRLRKQIDALNINSEEAAKLKLRIQELDKRRKSISSGDPQDPTYKRINYVRYCDDILIGVIGSKKDASEIMAQVTAFLNKELVLCQTLILGLTCSILGLYCVVSCNTNPNF